MPGTGDRQGKNARGAVVKTLEGHTPTCPRCGYDLSVSTQLWPDDRCPTGDTCTECGLAFSWGELLNRPFVPKWLVEHRPFNPLAWLRAMVVPLVPWVAMKSLPLALPRRARTLWTLVPCLVLVVYLAVGLSMQSHLLMPSHSTWWEYSIEDSFAWPRMLTTGDAPRLEFSENSVLTVPFALIVAHAVLMPLTFLTMDTTLGKANIRLSHLLRLGMMHLVTLFMWALAIILVRTSVDVLASHGVTDEAGMLRNLLPAWTDPTAHPEDGAPVRSVLLYGSWALVSWWAACRWYLRLRWALFHTAVLWFIAVLASIVSMMLIGSALDVLR